MKKEEILTLYEYNTWANNRILDTAAKIDQEQFLATASFSHGGIRGTLVHTLFAEWIWRSRWEGHSPTEWMKSEDFPTFEALLEHWEIETKNLMTFVKSVNETSLYDKVHYRTTGGRSLNNILWHLMVHLVNHGTQHRSETAAMLTDFGHSPGDIDMLVYLREIN
jgi:uncharacterized damage-inducible protein DinB